MEHVDTLCGQNEQLLGAFTKLRKVTISLVMCVSSSARMQQLGSLWTNFY